MNFTQNTTQGLAGRIQPPQQQQVHQIPVTTSGAPGAGNMQKNSNAPSFQLNQQAPNMVQKINDDKNQLPPVVPIQIQQTAQNNNNHGMGGGPQQLLNVQANMNRSLNPFQHQQQHLGVNIGAQAVGGSVTGSIFQQMQKMAYQQSHHQFPQVLPPSQSQLPPSHTLAGQQSILHKLQTPVPATLHQLKPSPGQQQQHPQQSMKPVSSQVPPSVSQNNMQYSPPKPNHPQMKTTAKLASPGSQLHNLQKSPTAPNQPQATVQQAASTQNKNVPSTPNVSVAASPAMPLLSAAPPQSVSISPLKPPAQSTTAKPPPLLVASQIPTLADSASAVPSMQASIPISTTSQATAKIAPAPAQQQAPTKAVEQPKVASQATPTQSKTVPKPVVEEKKSVPALNNVPTSPETNNKVDKTPAKPLVVTAVAPPPAYPTISPSPSKNTMRLATVTPARQKKPPPTINKKPAIQPVAAPAPSVPKAPAKPTAAAVVASPPPKPVEALKSPAKRPPPAPPAAAKTPKMTTASLAQSTSSSGSAVISPKTKRSRVKVQPYQSPTPELALVTKLSTQIANSSNKNGNDDKLKIFYKNEFLAVRNGEGSFYLCQAQQNVYKSSSKIQIRWLNEKNEGKVNENGDRIYSFDYFDITDFECVLTTVELDKGEAKNYFLPKEEQTRIENILKKAIDVEKGIVPRPTVTEENPDGLDLSLYKDEAQLDKISPRKRRREAKSDEGDDDDEDDDDDYESPRKKKPAKRATVAKPPPAIKTPRLAATKKVAAYESTESDEENLMEIQKKAKKQIPAPKPSTSKASEPMPSTSKAAIISTPLTGKGRKRVGKAVEEVAAKITKTITKFEPVKESPTAKTPAKPKASPKAKAAVKKSVPEKASPVVEDQKPLVEKKTVAEKKPAVKKVPATAAAVVAVEEKSNETKSQEVKPVPTKNVQEKSPAKAAPKKKAPTPSTSTDQPSTSRSRNTRSKK